MMIGIDFVDTMKAFMEDDDTDIVVMIGQLGGSFEEEAAHYYHSLAHKKPVISFVAGDGVPFGHKMGYAGDIITKGHISVQDKRDAMSASGMIVVNRISQIHEELQKLVG